jgi:phosphoglycerol transferase
MFARCAAWAHYPVALVLCLAALAWSLRLDEADLDVPFAYTQDSLGVLALIKGQIDQRWFLVNDRLGAPGVYDLRDYPVTDVLPLALFKVLGWLRPTPGAVFNLFFLLTFPLTTLTTLAVLRHFRLPPVPAVAASVLYTFLPYHIQRIHIGHLFLTAYFLVPPAVMVILWVCQGRPIFFAPTAHGGRWRLRPAGPAALIAVAVCLLTAALNVYYAFFTCFLLLAAAGFALARRGDVRAASSAGVLIAVIVAGVAAAGAPALRHQARAGANPDVQRSPEDADVYCLKVAHLLLPVQEHQAPALGRLRAAYSTPHRPLENENNLASLGMVGAAGFLLLLGLLLAAGLPPEIDALRVLNVAALLLGVAGGFGSLFNFLAYGQIRCYNRVSVFIAFFALFAAAWLAGRVFFAPGRGRAVRLLGAILVACVTVFGLWDQTPQSAAPDHERLAAEFRMDAEFARRAEASLPAGAMVFQLPYTRFPECTVRHEMGDYQHFRPYLHSRALHWSYGAMSNREADAWQRQVVGRPVPEMVRVLALAGFGGLYVDRRGFAPDEASRLTAALDDLLGPARVRAGDGRRCLYDLTRYAERLKARYTPRQWAQERERALRQPCVLFREGFFANLSPGGDAPRWCRSEGTLVLLNPGGGPRNMELVLACRSDWAEAFPLELSCELFTHKFEVHPGAGPVTFRFTLPPGRHPVHFTAQPPQEYVPPLPGHVFYLNVLAFRDVD